MVRNNKGKRKHTVNLNICWRVGRCDVKGPERLLIAGRGGSLILFLNVLNNRDMACVCLEMLL